MTESEIVPFLKNQTFFITGGTGFLGKLLIEKILRVCYDVKMIYLLVRDKNGKNINERLDKLVTSSCFDVLKTKRPNFKEKLKVLGGDTEADNLGLSEESLKILRDEVTIIVHSAATIKFNEKLRRAALLNIGAIRSLLKIAREMPQLKSFVHVSTAYSNCLQNEIREEFYKSPMTADNLFNLLEAVDDETLDKITPHLVGDLPNTYIYTKNIAENCIQTEGAGLPLAIIRPSIVGTPYREPIPGWTGVVQGIAALTLGCYLGVCRAFWIKNSARFNVIPVDHVVNNILAVAWNTCTDNLNNKKLVIYNSTCPNDQTISWGDFIRISLSIANKYSTNMAIWCPIVLGFDNKYPAMVVIFLVHTVPGHVADFVLTCLGKKPMLVKVYQKIAEGADLMRYFMMNTFFFHRDNSDRLWSKMNDVDKDLFEFRTEKFEWEKYLEDTALGARKYLLKDPIETLPRARRKLFVFKALTYVITGLFFYFLYVVLRLVLALFKLI